VGHTGLLPYLDGEWSDDGRVRLVAVYVPGCELPVFLRRAAPPPELQAAILAAVCEAVGAAHRRGLTNGHLTPSDVLIVARQAARPPSIVVRDFGLADITGQSPGYGADCRALGRLLADAVTAGGLKTAAIDSIVAELRCAGEDPVAAAALATRAAEALAVVARDAH
jgi:serine/threonine-protein kinase